MQTRRRGAASPLLSRSVWIALLVFALAVGTVLFVYLARFAAEDQCLATGGRVDHVRRVCEWRTGTVPLADMPRTVTGLLWIAAFAFGQPLLALWLAWRYWRRLHDAASP